MLKKIRSVHVTDSHSTDDSPYLIGVSDKNSTPPAAATSAAPASIIPAQSVRALLAEMQAIVTVEADRPRGSPDSSTASRATLLVLRAGKLAKTYIEKGPFLDSQDCRFLCVDIRKKDVLTSTGNDQLIFSLNSGERAFHSLHVHEDTSGGEVFDLSGVDPGAGNNAAQGGGQKLEIKIQIRNLKHTTNVKKISLETV